MITVITDGEMCLSDDEAVNVIVGHIDGWAMNSGERDDSQHNLRCSFEYGAICDAVDRAELASVLYQSSYEGLIWAGCEISRLLEAATRHYVSAQLGRLRRVFVQELVDYLYAREDEE